MHRELTVRSHKRVTEFSTTWAMAHPIPYKAALGDLLAHAIYERKHIRIEYDHPESAHKIYVIVWDPAHATGELEL